jgi:hypothetical protein
VFKVALRHHITPADRRKQAHHRGCSLLAHVLLEPDEQLVVDRVAEQMASKSDLDALRSDLQRTFITWILTA